MKRLIVLLLLAFIVIVFEVRFTPSSDTHLWGGIPFLASGSEAAWTVDVATGERGQSGWTVFRLSGEGADDLAVIGAAIESQTWLDFELGLPRLDWALCCGVVGHITGMEAPASQGWN